MDELPPLPEPHRLVGSYREWFTADQLQAFAQEAVTKERERWEAAMGVRLEPLLMQDENSGRDGRRYNEWHASRPDARLNAREAAAALSQVEQGKEQG